MNEKRVTASPATRNLAKELGIDLQKVKGTGYEGRIDVEDIQDYIAAGGETKGVEIKGLEITKAGKELNVEDKAPEDSKEKKKEVSFDNFFNKNLEDKEDYIEDEIEENIKYETADENIKKEVESIFESFDFVLKSEDEEDKVLKSEKEELPNQETPIINGNSIKTKFGEIIDNNKNSEIEDYIAADEDMIQFMIKHENNLRDELDGTVISNDSKVQVFTREYDEHDNINKKTDKMQREDLETLKDQIKELYKAVENNPDEQVVKEKEHDSDNDYVQEAFTITLNDESIGTVHLNIDEDDVKMLKDKEILSSDSKHNDLLLAGHTHNSIAMGIGVKLKQVNEIVKYYDRKDNNAIMYIVVKAIAHSMKVNNISNFNDSLRLSKYTDNSNDFYLDDITNMKISEFEDKKVSEKEDYLYEVLDLTSLGIDYYFPKESEGHVEIVILGDYKKIKIIVNADKNLLSFEEITKVLSSLKEVLNNPSLMIV